MGVDYTVIKDLIEDKGLPEYSQDAFLDAMNSGDHYQNRLYKKPVAEDANASQFASNFSYAYHQDPVSGPPQGGNPL